MFYFLYVMRKTKIVATIGPASRGEKVLSELVKAGLNVARLNFSHGKREEHAEILGLIREKFPEICVMLDTQGPEIRLGVVSDGTILEEGDSVELSYGGFIGDSKKLPVDHPHLSDFLSVDDLVLLVDGEVELKVEEVNDSVLCRVIYGGKITSRKSVNVPGKDVGLETPTEKDIKDIRFGIEHGFDLVSLSFVKSGDDIRKVKKLLDGSGIQIVAKIEHMQAVENIDEIIREADAVMIARGDLGVEVPASEVPLLQKTIIQKCNLAEKPVIVATQMLKSMTESPRATRAEVSDVANAVVDGADAVMLSEETAVGNFPVKSLEVMSEVAVKMEEYLEGRVHHTVGAKSKDTADIIAKSVWQACRDINAKYIVAHTSSGYTAHKIAKLRPDTHIIAFTDSHLVRRQLNLVRGVKAYYIEFPEHVDMMFRDTTEFLFDKGEVKRDDLLILTAGVPQPVTGITNMMEIRTVGSLLEE